MMLLEELDAESFLCDEGSRSRSIVSMEESVKSVIGIRNGKEEKPSATIAEEKSLATQKDNSLSIFHAIGKFLYNKRTARLLIC